MKKKRVLRGFTIRDGICGSRPAFAPHRKLSDEDLVALWERIACSRSPEAADDFLEEALTRHSI